MSKKWERRWLIACAVYIACQVFRDFNHYRRLRRAFGDIGA
jgi:hypothetical protein